MTSEIIRADYQTRRMEIHRIAEKIGLWNISRREMGKKYNVSERTIYQDIQMIYKRGIDKNCLQQVKVNFDMLNRALLTDLQAEFFRSKGKDKATIAHALLAVEEKHIDFLERFGLKDFKPASETNIVVVWGEKDGDK